jgi:hypothetical protein
VLLCVKLCSLLLLEIDDNIRGVLFDQSVSLPLVVITECRIRFTSLSRPICSLSGQERIQLDTANPDGVRSAAGTRL